MKKNSELSEYERKQKNRLNKIHKLKRENRQLSNLRKNLKCDLHLNKNIYLKTIVDCIISGRSFIGLRDSTERMFNSDVDKISNISEQIGKNSNRIMRLRILISQDRLKTGDK